MSHVNHFCTGMRGRATNFKCQNIQDDIHINILAHFNPSLPSSLMSIVSVKVNFILYSSWDRDFLPLLGKVVSCTLTVLGVALDISISTVHQSLQEFSWSLIHCFHTVLEVSQCFFLLQHKCNPDKDIFPVYQSITGSNSFWNLKKLLFCHVRISKTLEECSCGLHGRREDRRIFETSGYFFNARCRPQENSKKNYRLSTNILFALLDVFFLVLRSQLRKIE